MISIEVRNVYSHTGLWVEMGWTYNSRNKVWRIKTWTSQSRYRIVKVPHMYAVSTLMKALSLIDKSMNKLKVHVYMNSGTLTSVRGINKSVDDHLKEYNEVLKFKYADVNDHHLSLVLKGKDYSYLVNIDEYVGKEEAKRFFEAILKKGFGRPYG